jgi:hypothetical protein
MGWGSLTADFGDYLKLRALAASGGDFSLMASRSSADVQVLATRAASDAVTTADGVFGRVAQPFLESLGQSSILDRVLAEGAAVAMSYSQAGAVVSLVSISGGAVGELAPKPVRSASFAAASLAQHKAVALCVASEEFLRGAGASEALTAELRRAVAQATNAVFLDALAAVADTIAASGSTAAAILTDLTAAIAALGPHERSRFYAAVDPTTYAEVGLKPSTATAGPLAFPDFPTIGSVTFMASESLSNTALVFDASRLAIGDGGLAVDQSRHGSLQMDDAPSGNAAPYSLWERNARGIRAERFFSLAFATPDTSGSLPAIQITNAW